MADIDVWSRIREADDLPALSATATRVIHSASDPDSSLKGIAEIIAENATLSDRVVRSVNSGEYGLSQPVESVNQATVILGIDVIANLTLSLLVLDLFPPEDQDGFDRTGFWKRAIASAAAARAIAAYTRFPLVEQAFVVGLLEDIGVLLLSRYAPALYPQVLREAQEEGVELTVVEEELLGVTHVEVGQFIAEKWNLPPSLSIPIACHHHVEDASVDPTVLKLSQYAYLGGIAASIWYGWDKALELSLFKAELSELAALGEADCNALLASLSAGIRDAAVRLQVDIGPVQSYDELLREATLEAQRLRQTYDGLYRQSRRTRGELELRTEEVARLSARMEQREREFVELIDHDPLTGLLTRRFFGEVLVKEVSRARRYGRPLSLACVSIDAFEQFSDAHGSASANLMLRGTAQIVTKCVRDSDLCARYAEHSFLVLLVETDMDGGTIASEKIRRVVERWQVVEDGKLLSVRVSVGLTCLTSTAASADELLTTAQRALAKAVAAGGNIVSVEGGTEPS